MTTRHDGEADPDLREKGIASAVVRYIEAHENASLTVLILLFLLYAVTTAIRRPFWYDEMFSYTLATLPTWRDIHVAMPPDGNPPLFTFLARLFLPWLRPVELALRMPSVLAYTASLPITFLMMRRHFGVLTALTAVLLLETQPFAVYYASEARPYSLVLFFTSLGFYSWMRATSIGSPNRRFLYLLAICFAGLVLSHHLAIIGLGMAVLLGEITRLVKRKSVDFGVLGVTALGLSALALTLPMMRATKMAMLMDVSVNQELSLRRLMTSYTDASGVWFRPFVILLLIATIFAVHSHRGKLLPLLEDQGWYPHELAGLLGMTGTLIVVFLALRLSTGYYAGPRYGFAVFLSLSALGATIAALYPKSARLVICAFLVASFPMPRRPVKASSVEAKCLASLPGLPIAIGRGLYYPTAWHYSNPQVRQRLFYPYGAEKDDTGRRWIESSAIILAQGMMQMKTEPYQQFLETDPAFLLVEDAQGFPDEAALHSHIARTYSHMRAVAAPDCQAADLQVYSVSR